MRIAAVLSILSTTVCVACASAPTGGPLGEGTAAAPTLSTVDSTRPPTFAWVHLPDSAYVALLLVAPGYSGTLLYPPDSVTTNSLSAGSHKLDFQIPSALVQSDSARMQMLRQRFDSANRQAGRPRSRSASAMPPGPLPAATPTYLLLVTSPRPLTYRTIVAKTAGVSIPSMEREALNAVAKAVKSTIATEPRDWAAAFQRVEVRP